jgi:hypothetical protein
VQLDEKEDGEKSGVEDSDVGLRSIFARQPNRQINREVLGGHPQPRGGGGVRLALEVAHQRGAHAKDGVLVEPRVRRVKHFGDQAAVAGRFHDDVVVGRTPSIAVRHAQQLAHGPVGGHQVGAGPNGGELEAAVGLHLELAAQVVLWLVVVQLPVHAVVGVLPEVEGGFGQRLAVDVGHAPADQHRGAHVVFDQVGAVVHPRRASGVEGPQHAAFGGAGSGGQQVHQRRQAQHIGHQGEFAARGAADLSGAVQKANALAPFVVGQLCLGGKGVQVVREAVHQVPQPLIVDVGKAAFDGVRQVVSGDVFHRAKAQRCRELRG